jgi:hypothetical protein
VFDGYGDGLWQGGGAAIAAKIVINGGGSFGGLTAGSGVRWREGLVDAVGTLQHL